MNLETIKSKNPDVVVRKVSEEYVLVPLNNDIADMDSIYTMNDVGAFIWDKINGERSVSNIIDEVIQEYDISSDIAKNDVVDFLEDIKIFLK